MIFRLLYFPKPIDRETRRETENKIREIFLISCIPTRSPCSASPRPAIADWAGLAAVWSLGRVGCDRGSAVPSSSIYVFSSPGFPPDFPDPGPQPAPRRRLCFLRYFKCQKSRWSDLGPKIKHEHTLFEHIYTHVWNIGWAIPRNLKNTIGVSRLVLLVSSFVGCRVHGGCMRVCDPTTMGAVRGRMTGRLRAEADHLLGHDRRHRRKER